MKTIIRTFLICLLVPTAVTFAQDKPTPAAVPASPNISLFAHNKMAYDIMKKWLLISADKMPAGEYNFKPTPAVRSYGEILGHVADQHYRFCSLVRVETYPNLKIAQTKTSKADIIAALKDAFTYCDKAYDGMTDASATETVKLGPSLHPKLGMLYVNVSHSALHYGNLITYMRLKNIVPPSTEAMEGPKPKE